MEEVTVFQCPHPDADSPRDDIGVHFFTHGIFIETLHIAEDRARVNSWLFLDFSGQKLGSYIYESRSKQLLSGCRASCRIETGDLLILWIESSVQKTTQRNIHLDIVS